MNSVEEVAKILLQKKAVFLRPEAPFTWTSGIKSPVYCDNRLLISSVSSRNVIIKAFLEKIDGNEIDLIAGTATAGIPWAAWIAHELKLPLVYIRSSAKEHGRHNAVEGSIEKGQRAVLIEDLVSTGKSSISAAQKLKESGVEVKRILSIFTYNFREAVERFEKENLKLTSLTDFESLVQIAYQQKTLDNVSLEQVLKWKESVVFP